MRWRGLRFSYTRNPYGQCDTCSSSHSSSGSVSKLSSGFTASYACSSCAMHSKMSPVKRSASSPIDFVPGRPRAVILVDEIVRHAVQVKHVLAQIVATIAHLVNCIDGTQQLRGIEAVL